MDYQEDCRLAQLLTGAALEAIGARYDCRRKWGESDEVYRIQVNGAILSHHSTLKRQSANTLERQIIAQGLRNQALIMDALSQLLPSSHDIQAALERERYNTVGLVPSLRTNYKPEHEPA